MGVEANALTRDGLCSLQIQMLMAPLQGIEMPLVRVLASMEALGIAIDEKALERELCVPQPLNPFICLPSRCKCLFSGCWQA